MTATMPVMSVVAARIGRPSQRTERARMSEWPANWADLFRGIGCAMCEQGRPESDAYGVRIHEGRYSDAYLQRADVQRGYTIIIWRGRHVSEPTELSEAEAAGYWAEVLKVARALIGMYRPLKMNYETLGNSLPHLHTHLIPRFADDPRPGQPFPLSADPERGQIPETRLLAEAAELRYLLR
jgi:diadenosine tetraphosphate (Ap4A) HIT family hydrolase